MQLVTIENLPHDAFSILEVNTLEDKPHFKAHLMENELDGNIYTLKRVIHGRQKKEHPIYCYKAARHDTYFNIK